MKHRILLAGLGLALVGTSVLAETDVDVSARLDFGARLQFDDGLYAGQSAAGADFFVGFEVDARMAAGAGALTFQVEAQRDTNGARDVFNVKQAHYSQGFDAWDILVGVNVERWGVAESRSVLNVLNARDETDVILGGDLIGAPMVNANYHTGVGTFSAYALLGFVPPNLSDSASRQRALWPVAEDRAYYEEGEGRTFDFAFRWSQNLSLGGGGLDVAAMYFNGTSRSPLSLPGCAVPVGLVTDTLCDAINDAVVGAFEAGFPPAGDPQDFYDALDSLPEPLVDAGLALASGLPVVGLIPYYQHVQTAGVSAVYTRGDAQLRFETAYTEPRSEDGYWSGVVGGDYTFHGLGPTDAAVTMIAEYLWDDRDTRSPATLFDNDVFLGLNLFLNDRHATTLRAGGFYDLDTDAQLYQISASTRINDQVRLEVNALHVEADGYSDPLSFIDNDNFLELKLSTYF